MPPTVIEGLKPEEGVVTFASKREFVGFCYELAGVATGPLLRDNPGYVFPADVVSSGVAEYIKEKTDINVTTIEGYKGVNVG